MCYTKVMYYILYIIKVVVYYHGSDISIYHTNMLVE